MDGAIIVTPNTFAWFMYFIAPFVMLAFFFMFRPQVAVILTIIGGLLFLPERVAIDPPVLPPFNKMVQAMVIAFIGCAIRRPQELFRELPRGIEYCYFGLWLCTIGTWLGNRDVLVYGVSTLPGLVLQDVISSSVELSIWVIIPYYIGKSMFTTSKDLRLFITMLAKIGLIYSLFCIAEMRLSPQLHRWVYGYYQHEFVQTIRSWGYRPMVFMAHGLGLASFMMATSVWTLTAYRTKQKIFGIRSQFLWMYQATVFVFCKSMGATMQGMVAMPMALKTSPRLQLRLASIVAFVILTYPALKLSNTFPADSLVEAAGLLAPDRAQSLKARFDNEALLMDRSRDRLLFGWGPFARARVYDSLGHDIAIPDGYWIIFLGQNGLIAFLCAFGLLLWPVYYAYKSIRKIPDKNDQLMIAAMGLVCVFNVLDMLPNSISNPLPFFFAGVLLGASRGLVRAGKRAAAAGAAVPVR